MSGAPGRIASYAIERVLGRGGMGTVYLARAPDGTRVALKLLHAAGERAEARFDRERLLGEALAHPAFVRVLDAGEHDAQPWLAMEYVEGRTLEAIRRASGRLPPGAVVELGRQLASGLAALHARGITHRDLKPENLMIDQAGRLRIMDLGLAKVQDAATLTATGSVVGTPWYLAPEQLGGAGVGPPADLFSVTLLLYLLLTGHHPFRSEGEKDFVAYFQRLRATPPRPWHRSGVGGPLDLFFRRGLAVAPGERFPDAPALIEAFEAALEAQRRGPRTVEETLEVDAPAPAPAPAPALQPAPAPKPRPTPVLPALGALLALGLGLGALVLARAPAPQVQQWEGLEAPSGRLLLLRLPPTPRLTAKGGTLLDVAADSPVRILRLHPDATLVEVSAGGSAPLFALEVADLAWKRPAWRARRYVADGSLELSVDASPWGPLVLRRQPTGARIVDVSTDPAVCRFRVPDPEDRGFTGLELVLQAGGIELAWAELPPELPAPARAAPFLAQLAELDPEPVLADAGALRALRARWEQEGFFAEYRALRPWLAARLASLPSPDPLVRELVLQVPKLGLLETAWLRAGLDSPIDLRKHGLSRPLRRIDFRWAKPVAHPSRVTWQFRKDYFDVASKRVKNLLENPTQILSNPLPPVTLAAPVQGHGWPWLILHVRRADKFCQHTFARATVNGHGPFWFFESPRRKLQAELKRRFPTRDWFHLRFRTRIPPDVLRPVNEVVVRFMPYDYQDTGFEDFVSLRAVSLEPGDKD